MAAPKPQLSTWHSARHACANGLCKQAMHPASIASLRVASSSFAVMKMTGHFDPDAASRCSSIPEIPPRWISSSKQVAVCTLSPSSNASAEANVRLRCRGRYSRALFRRLASSSTTITTVGCPIISVSGPLAVDGHTGRPTVDLDQWKTSVWARALADAEPCQRGDAPIRDVVGSLQCAQVHRQGR